MKNEQKVSMITIAEAAKEFGQSLSFFYKHIRAGSFNPVGEGYPVKLHREEVAAFLKDYDPYAKCQRALPDQEAVDLLVAIELGQITAAEVAQQHGISEATLSRWRSGERRPKLARMVAATLERAAVWAESAVATMRELEASNESE